MARTLVWLRDDLRLDDHPALHAAGRSAVVVWCLDPRLLDPQPPSLARIGPHRARFLVECLADLRDALRAIGGTLLVARGRPEDILPGLADAAGCDDVLWLRAATVEEQRVEAAVRAALPGRCRALRGHRMVHHDDLPFEAADCPPSFTRFRKAIEADVIIRPPLDAIARLDPIDEPAAVTGHLGGAPDDPIDGALPTVAELGCSAPVDDPRAVFGFRGGERAGRARVQHYLWGSDAVATYKDTRNGLLRADDSSKLSPWLAHGAISARRIYAELRRYEAERTRNRSTYWLFFELLWRDFFRSVAWQHGVRLFTAGGIQGAAVRWSHDRPAFERWCAGETGVPFVDAHMRELARTGWMSNRGRQNVASYLTRVLGIDWRWGAAWFEARLIDHDPCSNYGNWQYVAGVGNDRRSRVFDIRDQAERYDRRGRYTRRWVPELAELPDAYLQCPWDAPRRVLREVGLDLGHHYPHPLAEPPRTAAAR